MKMRDFDQDLDISEIINLSHGYYSHIVHCMTCLTVPFPWP